MYLSCHWKITSVVFAGAIVDALNGTVSIPPELTYLLPQQYSGELPQAFVNTNTTSKTDNALLAAAQKAPFISYDAEFLSIIGSAPTLTLVAERTAPFAGEAGVWDPDRNEVWFTSNTNNDSESLQVLNLKTSKIYTPKTSIPVLNPNGGYYFNGTIYITGGGTFSDAPCIYGIEPASGLTSIIVNTYFGLAFNGPNDVTWVKQGNKAYMFFTDDPISERYAPGSGTLAQLPDAVWRFDPQERSLVPVISRADILIPNGIRVNANQTKLYVTDSSATDSFPALDGGAGGVGSPATFVFDLDENMFPVNKRMIGIARSGVPDGIHIDDAGRIWTAEYEGVVVRNPQGKILGLFNSQAYSVNATVHVANFALAGDQLLILDVERLWSVKLAQTVVNPARWATEVSRAKLVYIAGADGSRLVVDTPKQSSLAVVLLAQALALFGSCADQPQCDLKTPSCGQCLRAGQHCEGYRRQGDHIFHDQSREIAFKVKALQQRADVLVHRSSENDHTQSLELSRLNTSATFSACRGDLTSLPASLQIPLESQAACFFFGNYADDPSNAYGNIYAYLPALYDEEAENSALPCIVRALGLAGMAQCGGAMDMMKPANIWYTHALRETNCALRDPYTAKRDETLFAVLLLSMYETNTGTSLRSMRSWLKHISGATALLDLRGERQLDTEMGCRIFGHLRTQIIGYCYQTRSPIPKKLLELSHLCHDKREDCSDALLFIIADFCNIRSQHAFHPPVSQTDSTTKDIISRCCSIAIALKNWHDDLPPGYCPSRVPVGEPNPEIPLGYYDTYVSIWNAALMNNYRELYILVHETLITQLKHLQQHHPSDTDRTSNLEMRIQQSTSMLFSLIEEVCASVPWLLGTNRTSAGISLLWPLYLCAQISPATAPLSSAIRNWIIERLDRIAAEMGVRQAMTLSKVLLSQREVTELLAGEQFGDDDDDDEDEDK